MQKAVIIYNDRVGTFRKIKAIDAVIDDDPSPELVKNIAETRSRNLMCFAELESYNNTGKWLNKHPLLSAFSLHREMERLLQTNPAGFLDEYSKVSGYVSRYNSYLNNEKRSEAQHAKDMKNLDKYREKEEIMKEILNDKNN